MYKKESESIRILIELCSEKNIAVSFSCGKDSLVVLDLARRIGIEKAVFADTSIEFQETLNYLETIQDYYNIDVVKSSKDFFSYVKDLGLPSRRYRWCCDVLKFGPLGKYAIENNIDAFITGLRREESKRRECYDTLNFNPAIPVPQVNPILDWTSEDIWNYIHKNDLPYNPLYDKFSRVGCWCCPYRSNKDEWNVVRKLNPEGVEKLDEIISEKAHQIKPGYKKLFSEGAWRSWVYPLKKISVGTLEINENSNSLEIRMNNNKQISKIKVLIGILGLNYEIINKKLSINFNKENKANETQQIKVLVEKAINCVQCSVCISSCDKNALYVDTNLKVNTDICENCGECLNSNNNKLRMKCIGRNYSKNRNIVLLVS